MFEDKKSLSETEIRTRYITPALVKTGGKEVKSSPLGDLLTSFCIFQRYNIESKKKIKRKRFL